MGIEIRDLGQNIQFRYLVVETGVGKKDKPIALFVNDRRANAYKIELHRAMTKAKKK